MNRLTRMGLAIVASTLFVVICTGCNAWTYSGKVYQRYVPRQGPDENFRIVKRLREQQKAEVSPLPAHLVRKFESAIADARSARTRDDEVQELLARYERIRAALRGEPVPVEAWPKEFIDPIGIEYVLILPGEFMMGSEMGAVGERPVHPVRIEKPFYMGKYEVTQAQWQEVMGNNPSKYTGDERPVDSVSWDDCQLFCKRLSEKIGIAVRLPSEAEWEYACRAGSSGRYCYGHSASQLGQYAWHGDFWARQGSHPVGQKHPNERGLYDMHGNVDEWCQDVGHGDYSGAPGDGGEWVTGGRQDRRVLRGGSWYDKAFVCRSAYRARVTPSVRYSMIGLRLASGT